MKKFYLLCCLFIFTANLSVKAQDTLFYDSFETYTDFEITNMGNWTLTDLDLLNTYTIASTTWANFLTAQAFIVWNPSATTPAVTGSGWQPRTGMKTATCIAAVPAGGLNTNDDWLISPQMTITGSSPVLSIWVKSATDAYGLERFNVGVSTTGTATTDFTFISASPYEEADTAWTEFTYDLSSYGSQSVYIAINCVSADMFGFLLDDFTVLKNGSVGFEEIFSEDISLYPSATSTFFTIENNSNLTIDNINIYTIDGKLVLSNEVNLTGSIKESISIESLPAGKYLVEIKSGANRAIKQVVRL